MRSFLTLATAVLLACAPAVQAQERETLGFGRIFTNDLIGDGEDRWRSGGYHFAVLRGRDWFGARPSFDDVILEYRFRAEIISPSQGTGPMGDRPYAGAVSLGLHGHFAQRGLDISVGADLIILGEQSGVSRFQDAYHDLFSLPAPLGTGTQIGDEIILAATGEVAWPVRLTDLVTLRPFVEAQLGAEDIARVGADVIIGMVGHDDLLIRDVVTGQIIRAVESDDALGFALIAGADWAQVDGSVYLPSDRGVTAEEDRMRARFGVHWQATPDISFFYGATYLSEEFVGQDGGQVVGGLKLNFNF